MIDYSSSIHLVYIYFVYLWYLRPFVILSSKNFCFLIFSLILEKNTRKIMKNLEKPGEKNPKSGNLTYRAKSQ